MKIRTITITICILALFLACAFKPSSARAQSSDQTNQSDRGTDETNLDTQLYLLIASDQEVDNARLPSTLEPLIKQLRSALPFKNYGLSTTLINRVKNEGRLNLKWVGGPMFASAAATSSTPSFNEFRVNAVKLVRDANGQLMVRMEGFSFGSRIPIQSGTAIASNGPAAPIINYEPTGLNTDISMRENEPVIVGTLNVGPSGDAIILVMSAKRTSK